MKLKLTDGFGRPRAHTLE